MSGAEEKRHCLQAQVILAAPFMFKVKARENCSSAVSLLTKILQETRHLCLVREAFWVHVSVVIVFFFF